MDVNPFGVFSRRGEQKVFTERVLVLRPRLFSRLWCVCVSGCVFFVGVVGQFMFGSIHTKYVERLGSDEAPTSPFWSRQYSNRGC